MPSGYTYTSNVSRRWHTNFIKNKLEKNEIKTRNIVLALHAAQILKPAHNMWQEFETKHDIPAANLTTILRIHAVILVSTVYTFTSHGCGCVLVRRVIEMLLQPHWNERSVQIWFRQRTMRTMKIQRLIISQIAFTTCGWMCVCVFAVYPKID